MVTTVHKINCYSTYCSTLYRSLEDAYQDESRRDVNDEINTGDEPFKPIPFYSLFGISEDQYQEDTFKVI